METEKKEKNVEGNDEIEEKRTKKEKQDKKEKKEKEGKKDKEEKKDKKDKEEKKDKREKEKEKKEKEREKKEKKEKEEQEKKEKKEKEEQEKKEKKEKKKREEQEKKEKRNSAKAKDKVEEPRDLNVKEIAILGGGPASLATAYYLTNQPDWQKKYSITIYQMGWRLGGKAASGRNEAVHERIEEHGIHIFGNYYKNIFDMVQACNNETNWEYLPSKSMENTFQGTSFSCNILWMKNNRIASNQLPLPCNKEKPWVGPNWYAGPLNVLYTLLDAIWALLTGHHLQTVRSAPNHKIEGEEEKRFLSNFFDKFKMELEEDLENYGLKLISLAKKFALKEIEKEAEKELKGETPSDVFAVIINLLDEFMRWLKKIFGNLILENVDHLSVYIQLDFYCAVLRGFIKDKLYIEDVDTIDHLDYEEWLIKHGIDKEYTLPSPIVRIAINSCFQFDSGNSTVPSHFSAASFVIFTIRAFLGKGPLIWKWIAGTGETIITPVYMALKKRGVKFRFFHKVTALHKKGDEIVSIDMEVQATPINGEYDPLRKLFTSKYPNDPFYVWGSKPDLNQLKEKDKLIGVNLESYWTNYKGTTITLNKGIHFDQVVFGISIGAIPIIASELVDNEKWKNMIAHLKPVRTQNCQVWFNKTYQEMGFTMNFQSPDFIVGGTFSYNFNDFIDFTDLIEVEKWDPEHKPKSLLYFCGPKPTSRFIPPFSDTQYPNREYESSLNQAMQYFQTNLGTLLFPNATFPATPTGFNFHNMFCWDQSPNLGPPDVVRQQYIRANIDPTELYVISDKGSAKYRLHAWDSGYKNLTLVGDWIYTGFNIGAIEAAVMSGALGSFALTGYPLPEDIQGYFFLHPNQKKCTQNVPHPLGPSST